MNERMGRDNEPIKPLISVVVPVYQAEKTLGKCVDSILAQTVSDFELLLVNDGSRDGSAAICEAYQRRDSRIRVFHKENGGVSSARNLGLDRARGTWVCFIDADDWAEPEYLSAFFLQGMPDEDMMVIQDIWCENLTTVTRKCHFEDMVVDTTLYSLLFSRFQIIRYGYPFCKLFNKGLIDRHGLQINTIVNSGSTGRIAEEIGQLAMSNGWDSYIAYGRNERESCSQRIRIGTSWQVRWHGIQTRLWDRHGLASKRSTTQLVERMKVIKPDIIHLHNLHGYYLNIEILFDFLASVKTPVVWTLHDCWPLTGHCAHFSFCGCDRWKTLCHDCPQKNCYPACFGRDRSRENFLLKKRLFTAVPNMTIVPVSKWLANIVSKSFSAAYPQKVIYNGVNPEVFTPKVDTDRIRMKYKLQGKTVLLGVASTWSDRKGLGDFHRLANLLPTDTVLVLVGLSDKQMKGLPDRIIGVRRTESIQELADLYNVADLFLNLTWEDNFPTTNIESLACGTPVLTYKTGGSVEAVDQYTGFVIEQGDLEGVVSVIDKVKRKGKTCFQKACRERALTLYNKKHRYGEYLELYNELLEAQ